MNLDPRLQKHVDGHPFPLVFVTISGAHLYGFASPDSDYDLRGVHLLPLEQVVGLGSPPETVEQSCVDDGLEIDLVTHDAKKFFTLMLRKNGYVLEQVLSPLVLHTTAEHEELRAIAADCITRHHAHHYLGFAETQWGLFAKEHPPRVKPLLYVYRVLLTGIHLMRTGRVEANLAVLNDDAGLPYIPELIDRKRTGAEKQQLTDADHEFHHGEYLRLRDSLRQAFDDSKLPEAPRGTAALDALLVRLRIGRRGGGVGAGRPGDCATREETVQFADYSPPQSPSLAQQADALQKGLGRAWLWAQAGRLADEPLLNACLHDRRCDPQCEDNRGDWLWGLVKTVGAAKRFRGPILQAIRSVTVEGDGHQLSQLASHYALAGDAEFRAQLYELVERKPVASCPWVGEGQLLELDGETAFQFLARARGERLATEPWDWYHSEIADRAVEKSGEAGVRRLLADASDPGTARFAAAWRQHIEQTAPRNAPSPAVAKRSAPVSELVAAAQGDSRCAWFGGWGRHAEDAALREVLGHLWSTREPKQLANWLRVFTWRAMPEFDSRLIDLCGHADADVRRRAFVALARNRHPEVRALALDNLAGGHSAFEWICLFVNNYEPGDERRIAEAIELPYDRDELHWLLIDLIKVFEENPQADFDPLGVAVYALIPCEICRFRAAKRLHAQEGVPAWMADEYRHDSNEEFNTLL